MRRIIEKHKIALKFGCTIAPVLAPGMIWALILLAEGYILAALLIIVLLVAFFLWAIFSESHLHF